MSGPIRIGTFNVFWLGAREANRIPRTPRDEADLSAVLRSLDADVLVLQEIVDVPLLERLLSGGPRRYRLRDAHGRWLTTGAMRSRRSHIQKLVLAFDEGTMELRAVVPAFGRAWPGPRRPIVARLRHSASGFDLTVIGVHLKSGSPLEAADSPEARTRKEECEALVRWIEAAVAPSEAAVLLGDFNAVREHVSLDPLRRLPPGWTWHDALLPDDEAERWTAYSERSVVDHVFTSPAASAAVEGAPWAYAFDLDPALDRAPAGPVHFLRSRTGLVAVTGPDEAPAPVENLYRISDHRPLLLSLRPPPGELV